MSKVEYFTLHNDRGESIPDFELLNWRKFYPNDKAEIFGPVTKYSWHVHKALYEIQKQKGQSWEVIPDASGFICFESASKPDNCLLLDAYGKERMRLSVPWQMTGATNPEAEKVSTFDNISEPYVNPADGKEGQFGVTGWVGERKYYFELDYRTGQFLWCKPIRD